MNLRLKLKLFWSEKEKVILSGGMSNARIALKKEMKRLNVDFPNLTIQKLEVFRKQKGLSMRAAIRMIVNDFVRDKPEY